MSLQMGLAITGTVVVAAASSVTQVSSFALVRPLDLLRSNAPTCRSSSVSSPRTTWFASKSRDGDDSDKSSFLDKAADLFQKHSDGATPMEKGVPGSTQETAFERHRAAARAALGMDKEAKKIKPETPFDRHRAAAGAAFKEVSDRIASLGDRDMDDNSGEGSDRVTWDGFHEDVDERLRNRILVHAEKILSDDPLAVELLGGRDVDIKKVPLSQRKASIVVGDGGKETEGIRAIAEVVGPQRSGTVLVVGDRRGVLMLKLTVGGTTIDVKTEEGLAIDTAHGVKKSRS